MEILEELDRRVKDHFGALLVSIVVNSGESAFLSIWKKPPLDQSPDFSSMRYLPLFYVICSLNKSNNLTLKLITHHGKVVDSLTETKDSPLDQTGKVDFIKKLTRLRMCQGVRKSNFLNDIPHLVEQLEQNIIIRSRQCQFALFNTEICYACQLLSQNKSPKSCSRITKNTKYSIRKSLAEEDAQGKDGNLGLGIHKKSDEQNLDLKAELDESLSHTRNDANYILGDDSGRLPGNVLLTELELVGDTDDISCLDVNKIFEGDPGRDDEASQVDESRDTEDGPSPSLTRRVGHICDICAYRSSGKAQLRKHVSLMHQIEPVPNEGITTPHKISRLNKNNNKLSHSCDECSFKTAKHSKLHDHINTVHKKIKPFICEVCEHKSVSKSELNKHLRRKHSQTKEFKCPNCSFETSRKTGLTDHINAVHDKVKPYMCQHCSHTFASNGNLTQHIHAVHERLRPFICQYCTYSTSSQPNLRKHIKAVHHKIRDFKCDICPFDAASKQLLDRHVKAVHEKIKGHKCKYCQYECAKGYNMKVHIRHVHEKVKGYKCEQCSFEATRKGKLTEHVLACHGTSQSDVPAETVIVQSEIEAHSVLVD